MMKRIFTLILFLFILKNISCQTIDERTGVLIYYQVDKNTFPISWTTNKYVSAKGVSLDSTEIERSLKVIRKALNKYPAEVISQNLKKICILKTMEIHGEKYGGTYSTDAIYMTNNGVLHAYTDFNIEKIFHHEFSSILLYNYRRYLKKRKWRKFNNIKYGNGGLQALKDSTIDQKFRSSSHINGFLHRYANSDFENDINSFADNLFTPSENFHEIVSDYPLLSGKLELILKFYASIDKTFTKEYFIEINNKVIHNKE